MHISPDLVGKGESDYRFRLFHITWPMDFNFQGTGKIDVVSLLLLIFCANIFMKRLCNYMGLFLNRCNHLYQRSRNLNIYL